MSSHADKPTFAAVRRDRILELVRSNGTMALRDIAAQVRASEVTVRRDVRALEAEGLIDRRRGGAAIPGRLAKESGLSARTRRPATEELAIAHVAATMVENGDAVVIGPGTATEALAREIGARTDLTVVTNALPVASALAGAPGVDVVMTGGTLRGSLLALVGSAADQALHGIRVRRAFLAGEGINGDRGLSTPNHAIAEVDRAMADAAEEVVVLADHTRVGAETMVQTIPPDQVTHLVTDSHADPEVLMELEEYGTRVHIAVLDSDLGQ